MVVINYFSLFIFVLQLVVLMADPVRASCETPFTVCFKNILSMCFLSKCLLRVFRSRRSCSTGAVFLPGFLRVLRVETRLCAHFGCQPSTPLSLPCRSHVLRAGARQTACWELPRLPCAGVDLCRGTGSPHTYFGSPLSGEGIFVRGFSTRGGCWESLRLATSWDLDVSASILGVSTLYFPADILGLGLFFAQNSRWYHAQAGSA